MLSALKSLETYPPKGEKAQPTKKKGISIYAGLYGVGSHNDPSTGECNYNKLVSLAHNLLSEKCGPRFL